MSESDTEDTDADNPGVTDVLNALAPLTAQMETLAGFVVQNARRPVPGHPPDPEVVEVRITLSQPRHPREVDMAHGMLQGHGYSVVKDLRGDKANVKAVLRVTVDGESPDTIHHSDGEQVTF